MREVTGKIYREEVIYLPKREDSARTLEATVVGGRSQAPAWLEELTRTRVPVRKDGLTGALQVTSLRTGKIERSAEALRACHGPLLSLQTITPEQSPAGDRRDKTQESDANRAVLHKSSR